MEIAAERERKALLAKTRGTVERAAVKAEVDKIARFLEISGVTPEKLVEARKHLKAAMDWIQKKMVGKKLPIKLNIDYNNPDKYLP